MDNTPEFPPSTVIDAWKAGWVAHRAGLPFAANPHRAGLHAHQQWRSGWLDSNSGAK